MYFYAKYFVFIFQGESNKSWLFFSPFVNFGIQLNKEINMQIVFFYICKLFCLSIGKIEKIVQRTEVCVELNKDISLMPFVQGLP